MKHNVTKNVSAISQTSALLLVLRSYSLQSKLSPIEKLCALEKIVLELRPSIAVQCQNALKEYRNASTKCVRRQDQELYMQRIPKID